MTQLKIVALIKYAPEMTGNPGVIGDLFDVVPQVTAKIARRQARTR